MKMAHTCVRVKDLDASLEFYQKHLALKKAVVATFQKVNLHLFI